MVFGIINEIKDNTKTKTSELKDSVKKLVKGSVNSRSLRQTDIENLAEKKVNFKISLKIHMISFLFGMALLFIINLLFTPGYLWVYYPFYGWLLGYGLHCIAYLVYTKPGSIPVKNDVIFHGIVYLAVNALLFGINYLTTPTYYWVFYPVIFWGFGLILHIVFYNIFHSVQLDSKTGAPISKKEREIQKEIKKLKQRRGSNVVK